MPFNSFFSLSFFFFVSVYLFFRSYLCFFLFSVSFLLFLLFLTSFSFSFCLTIHLLLHSFSSIFVFCVLLLLHFLLRLVLLLPSATSSTSILAFRGIKDLLFVENSSVHVNLGGRGDLGEKTKHEVQVGDGGSKLCLLLIKAKYVLVFP